MATIIMDPPVAILFKDAQGFKRKDRLSKWFSENAEISLYAFGNEIECSTKPPESQFLLPEAESRQPGL
jgi:hypothetical protein